MKGTPLVGEDGPLDVVIIQQRDAIKLTAAAPPTNDGNLRNTCKRHQRGNAARQQRHNATQTPDSALSWKYHGLDGCQHVAAVVTATPHMHMCCCNAKSNCCTSSTTTHATNCHRHELSGDLSAELTCHCHITHHCHHHYSPPGGNESSSRSHVHHRMRETRGKRRHCERRRRHYQQHHHNHNHHHHNSHHSGRHLPASSTKSSFESSDEQLNRRHKRQQLQQIAIEIDAATMTEDNTSTATSNFAYKMATDSIAPIIMAPVHHGDGHKHRHRQRQGSLNSNTTIDTDELSPEDDDADIDEEEDDDDDITPHRRSTRSSSSTPLAICRDKDKCRSEQIVAHNECVKIKRKRFIAASQATDCSTCSSCSCTCTQDHVRTSSCSSLDGDIDDDDEFNANIVRELTVSADCHRCNLQRQSTASTVEDEDAVVANITPPPQRLVQETTDSSARTSRRSSASFCSCQSTSCCYCSCSCDDCEMAHMRTAAETSIATATIATEAGEELHSRTLTPLTSPSSLVSTPLADDADRTLRHTLGEDASSLSQSAEYFSLSSCNQQAQATPKTTPTHKPITITNAMPAANSRKPCKHNYSKHHRHKHDSPPLDSYL